MICCVTIRFFAVLHLAIQLTVCRGQFNSNALLWTETDSSPKNENIVRIHSTSCCSNPV